MGLGQQVTLENGGRACRQAHRAEKGAQLVAAVVPSLGTNHVKIPSHPKFLVQGPRLLGSRAQLENCGSIASGRGSGFWQCPELSCSSLRLSPSPVLSTVRLRDTPRRHTQKRPNRLGVLGRPGVALSGLVASAHTPGGVQFSQRRFGLTNLANASTQN